MGDEGTGGTVGRGVQYPISDRAMDKVREEEDAIRKSKVENYRYIDRETGEVLASGEGTEGKVEVDMAVLAENPGQVFIHNHPQTSVPSHQDITSLATQVPKAEVRIVTPGGTVYRARTSGPISNKGLAQADIRAEWDSFIDKRHPINRWVPVTGTNLSQWGLQYMVDTKGERK